MKTIKYLGGCVIASFSWFYLQIIAGILGILDRLDIYLFKIPLIICLIMLFVFGIRFAAILFATNKAKKVNISQETFNRHYKSWKRLQSADFKANDMNKTWQDDSLHVAVAGLLSAIILYFFTLADMPEDDGGWGWSLMIMILITLVSTITISFLLRYILKQIFDKLIKDTGKEYSRWSKNEPESDGMTERERLEFKSYLHACEKIEEAKRRGESSEVWQEAANISYDLWQKEKHPKQ